MYFIMSLICFCFIIKVAPLLHPIWPGLGGFATLCTPPVNPFMPQSLGKWEIFPQVSLIASIRTLQYKDAVQSVMKTNVFLHPKLLYL